MKKSVGNGRVTVEAGCEEGVEHVEILIDGNDCGFVFGTEDHRGEEGAKEFVELLETVIRVNAPP